VVVEQGGLERGVAVSVRRSNYQRLVSLPMSEFLRFGDSECNRLISAASVALLSRVEFFS